MVAAWMVALVTLVGGQLVMLTRMILFEGRPAAAPNRRAAYRVTRSRSVSSTRSSSAPRRSVTSTVSPGAWAKSTSS